MAIYQAIVRRSHKVGELYIEKGMKVEFISFSPPWMVEDGKPIHDAFMRVYGIDLKKGFACNPGFIEVKEIK